MKKGSLADWPPTVAEACSDQALNLLNESVSKSLLTGEKAGKVLFQAASQKGKEEDLVSKLRLRDQWGPALGKKGGCGMAVHNRGHHQDRTMEEALWALYSLYQGTKVVNRVRQ